MLYEDEREAGGFETGAQGEDVGEGGGGHVEEFDLHVDDEQSGDHSAQTG